jgi:hypothetical protein
LHFEAEQENERSYCRRPNRVKRKEEKKTHGTRLFFGDKGERVENGEHGIP